MIVDLERNDLARVSRPDSIEVHDLFQVKPYASVYHLDAKVSGRIAPGMDAIDALFTLFPGGSITGAPKKRSMEIISELEGVRRGVYTGVWGGSRPKETRRFPS
jgi:para-aminobenzoate synthetase component 1